MTKIDGFLRQINYLNLQIAGINSKVYAAVKVNPDALLIKSILGIGDYSVLVISSEIAGIEKFSKIVKSKEIEGDCLNQTIIELKFIFCLSSR